MKTYLIGLLVLLAPLVAFRKQAALLVSSPGFSANGMMPSTYACDGGGISPALNISAIPPGARSLALIVHDPDAPHPGGMTHWVVFNLPVNGGIPEGFKGGVQARNGGNTTGYKPFCPPSGSHHYNFYVYALDEMLALDSTADKGKLESAMQGHILAQGKLTGLYRQNK